MKESHDPSSVVQRHDAYNARDVDAILATDADDTQQFEHPAKLLASGSAEPHGDGPHRHHHEEVTRTFPEGPGKIQLTSIYEVQAGKIAKAWFMSGVKALH